MSKRPGENSLAGNDPKRLRSEDPLAGLPPVPTRVGGAGPPPAAAGARGGFDVAAIRAQLAARMAALGAAASQSPSVVQPATPAPSAGSTAPRPPGGAATDIQARIAALKAQVAAKNANLNISGSSSLPPRPASPAADVVNPNIAKKGGLSAMPMHPSLLDHSASTPGEGIASSANAANKGKGKFSRIMAPKFTSVAANARLASATPSTSKGGSPMPTRPTLVAPSSNPYLSTSSIDPDLPPDVQAAQGEMDALATRRRKATLHFNAKGKYIQQAEEIRKEAKFEELRQRIAEQSRKAGLDSEFDVLERNIKRQPPPEIEWWDAPLLKNASYNDLDMGDEGTLIRSDDSLVTIYVQHPVPLPAPFESKEEQPRDLMLTKKEQKKMRRQRRAAELKDKQDRQRLGLLPMDPPKVKVANMMKVLTASAVQDPTKVEARVKAEAAARIRKHEQTNAERALTEEEKREKLEQKKAKEENKGIFGCAFKIKYLVNGAHKFKIRATAEQLALHGLLIFHPDFALVYVEGSAASLKKYKRLLTVRIDWTEEARPKVFDAPEGMEVDGAVEDGDGAARGGWQPMQERPESLADNKCEIVWEGELSQKNFRTFRYRNVESDRDGKESLGKGREGVWDLARKWIWEGVD